MLCIKLFKNLWASFTGFLFLSNFISSAPKRRSYDSVFRAFLNIYDWAFFQKPLMTFSPSLFMQKGSTKDVWNGSEYAFDVDINLVLDIVLEMTLEHFLAQRSKQITKWTVQITNSNFKAWCLSSLLHNFRTPGEKNPKVFLNNFNRNKQMHWKTLHMEKSSQTLVHFI